MKLLIKQARIVDPNSPFNGKRVDLLIEDGTLTQIGNLDPKGIDRVVSSPDLHVSPGWVDSFSNFADPGFEYKETLETGAEAAAAGGFTDVLIIPNTQPVIHNKAGVEYILHKSRGLKATIHPIGAVTRNTEGKELAEMYDMKSNDAVAFSDGLNCIQSSGLLIKALQYIKAFNGVLIQLPEDKTINPQGLINEGILSTQLGLPGKPAIGEELMVARDIALAAYAESNLHLTAVSTSNSIAQIAEAKAKKLPVTCSATPYHLFFCDEDLKGYDTNLKVNPPIRGREDRDALCEAVKNGTIDCIASHHLPHETDSKVIEFEYAQYGMIGLETVYAVLLTSVEGLSPERTVELLSTNPRKIFGLSQPVIQEGQQACLTIFDPSASWLPEKGMLHSRSTNSPFLGKKLKGKVLGTVHPNAISIS